MVDDVITLWLSPNKHAEPSSGIPNIRNVKHMSKDFQAFFDTLKSVYNDKLSGVGISDGSSSVFGP